MTPDPKAVEAVQTVDGGSPARQYRGVQYVQPTQVRRPWRSTARTVFQALVMLALIAPAIYSAAADHSPEQATGWAALGLAIAGAVTRIMAVPQVELFLRRFLPFLAAAPDPAKRTRDEAGQADLVTLFYVLGVICFTVATLWLLGVPTRGLFG